MKSNTQTNTTGSNTDLIPSETGGGNTAERQRRDDGLSEIENYRIDFGNIEYDSFKEALSFLNPG